MDPFLFIYSRHKNVIDMRFWGRFDVVIKLKYLHAFINYIELNFKLYQFLSGPSLNLSMYKDCKM